MISYLQENFTRKIFRRLGVRKNSSSFPYLSGDTFRDLCDYVMPPDFDFFFSSFEEFPKSPNLRCFLRAGLGSAFTHYLKNQPSLDLSTWILILHNDDNIPSESEFEYLASRFKDIKSVNWLGPLEIATPLPIGLENWSYWRNGVPSDFRKLSRKSLNNWHDRSIVLLCAFSLSTNLPMRRLALEGAHKCNEAHILNKPFMPSSYRKLLVDSKFVLSPPGNGVDCHRSWEAMYLGAVPIVLRKFWPFEHLKLPVLIVDDWEALSNEMRNYQYEGSLSVDEISKLFFENFIDGSE